MGLDFGLLLHHYREQSVAYIFVGACYSRRIGAPTDLSNATMLNISLWKLRLSSKGRITEVVYRCYHLGLRHGPNRLHNSKIQ